MPCKLTELEQREAFAQANHSARLEDIDITPGMIARQERIVRGEITHDQAVQEVIAEARERARTRDPHTV